MRLFEKGEISFVFLWVLNPIVILFYQNCAPSQMSMASTDITSVTLTSAKLGAETLRSPDSESKLVCFSVRGPCID